MADTRSNTKILVVDDEKLIRLTISAKLKSVGYTPVAAASVDEAVTLLKDEHNTFSAIISDIMMGDMDGFVFRDIVRGIFPSMPFFFMTALDPEEGSGFLKRIVEDPMSYYLPKAVSTEVLLKRVQRVVASRRIELFIERQMTEAKKALSLAAHVQRSMLPLRAVMTERGFYATCWRPKETVSGDLYEAVPFGLGCYLYVLGDIQGHGTSAALAMTAVQSFLKNLTHTNTSTTMGPADIANMMQGFFRSNLAEVSYMTALICVHRPLLGDVLWISCGAPDLVVVDGGKSVVSNPEKRGGLPIGLFPDTLYSTDDVVRTELTRTAVCIAYTDGISDISRDPEGVEKVSDALIEHLHNELIADARTCGCMISEPQKFMTACEEYGFKHCQDDVTELVFGARLHLDGIYEATIPLAPSAIDEVSQAMAAWCAEQSWGADLVSRLQLVLEEKLMNVYDHGFDDRDRLHEVVSLRLRRQRDDAELTVWDCGSPEPTLKVAAGSSSTAFELANQEMSNHGRGRLMVRELCRGIERKKFGELNETVYHVPFDLARAGVDGKAKPTREGEEK